MTVDQIALLVVAALLVVVAWMAACFETAIARISRVRADELVEAGVRGAQRLRRAVLDPARYLNLATLVRVIGEVAAAVLVTTVSLRAIGSTVTAVLIAILIMVLVSYVMVGVSPRTIGRQHPVRVAAVGAAVLTPVGVVFGPLARLLIAVGNAVTPGKGFREGPFASEAELRALVDIAEANAVIEADERRMVHSVFELGDTLVREVMVPRTDMVFIERHKTVRQAFSLALRSGFSRIPVVGDSADDVAGIVYLKDMARSAYDRGDAPPLDSDEPVTSLMRPAAFVPDSKPADELLRDMQARRIHLAVVVDEYGGTAGLVTIEDILEEIVGEITDEYDVESTTVRWLDADTARVTARLGVDELAELFEVTITDDDVDTVSGLLAKRLGRVPIPGAQVAVEGLELTAEAAEGRRNQISTVLVHRIRADESEP
jgi:CBS domain containing-hemolysin-like protein